MYRFGGLFESIEALLVAHPDLDRILIDMPMGLGSKDTVRTVEQPMRAELGARRSTVFSVPCRAALRGQNFAEANEINRAVMGKGISIQTFWIARKIKELDDILTENDRLKSVFIESHPEICFKYLNDETVLLSKKSKPEGVAERLAILQKYFPETSNFFNDILTKTPRKFVKKDDIIDALCLCIVNVCGGENRLQFIDDATTKDDHDIPIRIAFYQR